MARVSWPVWLLTESTLSDLDESFDLEVSIWIVLESEPAECAALTQFCGLSSQACGGILNPCRPIKRCCGTDAVPG
ncbi:hypothetical protein RESH_06221 [Rhodopirellula europaea SH398]|uniref:Uncharacterized protein n=1 Tax=Rhodopirellula europaea SH398 TaxID=1263868 RepID=M5S6A3_9BACT|nr:hypothetical protein RESH_06221 [Rhodopirellula europaea SH398]